MLKECMNERLVLILGLRRIGKSSLILATLNSIAIHSVYVDVRKVYDEVSKKVTADKLFEELHSSVAKLSKKEKLKEVFSKLEISVESPLRIKLSPDNFRREAVKVFDALNEMGKTVVTFDEAQYLRFSTVGLRSLLAYIYDHLTNITVVLTGSEIGLLNDFAGLEDPGSELYGRYYRAIEVKPFNRKTSEEFLELGFKELGVEVDRRMIEKAAEELGGIAGWLVYFGKLYQEKQGDVLNEVKEIGSKLVKKELDELSARSPYYIYIMKAIAVAGSARWKNVVDYVTTQTGKKQTNATISRDLNNLLKMGFIEKGNSKYGISDPIVRYAVLEKF